MFTLCFFPWLRLVAPLEAGGFKLRTMHVDEVSAEDSPFRPEEQDAVQSIVASFRDGPLPLQSFTLLSLSRRGLLERLNDEEMGRVTAFSQLLTLSGLSARRFFHHADYQNSDNFSLVVQDFVLPFQGVAVPARRRDGSSATFYPRGTYVTPKPPNVSLLDSNPVDIRLLESLCTAHQADTLGEVFAGIVQFNLANTDRQQVHGGVEVVQMVGAFEQVLGCRTGKEDDLAKRLSAALKPAVDLAPGDCPILTGKPKYRPGTPIREYWIRDLFQLRGHMAHGRLRSPSAGPWGSRAHLLLAAFALPLTLKITLQEKGCYLMSDADLESVDAFEYLLSSDLFDVQEPSSGYPWDALLQKARRERIKRKLLGPDQPGV